MSRPIESDYTSQVAYTRALEAYCDSLTQQEPFGWVVEHKHGGKCFSQTMAGVYTDTAVKVTTLYTSPPAQRKPLTDEEIEAVWKRVQANDFHDCVQPFARAIEAAHGIKGDA